jgi:hypothetical protein
MEVSGQIKLRPIYGLARNPVPIELEAGRVPKLVWTFQKKRKIYFLLWDLNPGWSSP